MNDLRTEFITWYFNEFTHTDLFRKMLETVEGSPHHRETNVGVHTNMVVGQYISTSNEHWTLEVLIGAFVCAFHDTGKPYSRQEAFSEERGKYYRFGGHELSSARFWETWAVDNYETLTDLFDLTALDIYAIGILIENHLPWSIKKPAKRIALAQSIKGVADFDTFRDILFADTWGRISDDGIEKRATVTKWCEDFEVLYNDVENFNANIGKSDAPVAYVLIGASGSGKSTFFANLKDDFEHFSLDCYRHEWYDMEDYRNAFKLACEDKKFIDKANFEYATMTRSGKSIALDNTNTSKKRRANYIRQARAKGYKVVAVIFPIGLQTLLDRQHTRGEKTVPEDVVRRQYMTLSLPAYGEFDEIIVSDGNLK